MKRATASAAPALAAAPDLYATGLESLLASARQRAEDAEAENVRLAVRNAELLAALDRAEDRCRELAGALRHR